MAGVAIQNVKILHKRYTDAQWNDNKDNDNYKLSLGEFGIAIDTGEVRGFIHGDTGDSAISWDRATPIGSVKLTIDDETPDIHSYIYGIMPIRQDNDESKPIIGYKLLKSTLPSLSVDSSSSESDYAETVITDISIDDTDDHKIKYKTSLIQPWTTDNKDNGLTTEEGTQVIRFIKDGSLSTPDHTHTHILTRNYNEIKFDTKSKLNVFDISHDETQNTYTVTFDDTLFGKTANLAGAMTFKGIINLNTQDLIQTDGITNGDTYKIVANAGAHNLTSETKEGASVYFHFANGEVGTSASLNHGDMIVYTELDPDGDGPASAHWCVIPSGDEPSGTVTEIEIGDGLITDQSDNKINSNGKIWHRAVADADSYYNHTGDTTESVLTTAEEIYAFPKLIQVDNNHEDSNNQVKLGHVNKIEWQTVKIFNEDTIDGKIYKAVPKFINGETSDSASTDKIRIQEETGTVQIFNGTEIQQPTFKIIHTEANTDKSGEVSDINKVSQIEYDEMGHITKLVYQQDIDTQRVINVDTQQEFGGDVERRTYGSGSAGNLAQTLTYQGSDNIKLSADNDGNITITTRGIATSNEYGFIKAGYSIDTTDDFDISYNEISGEELAASNVSAYPVRVNSNNGTAWVRVPDHKYASNVGANKPQDMYAFSTDAYGHISQVSPITCIDGNPPIES